MKVYIGKYPSSKSTKKQKIDIRIDPHDTWSMDRTLAHIIHPMLIQLKETKHGAPIVDDEDVPEKLRSTSAPPKENEWDADEHFFERWDWVLDEMIWVFAQLSKDDFDEEYYALTEEGAKKREEHDYRTSNALCLFSKYYRDLWD